MCLVTKVLLSDETHFGHLFSSIDGTYIKLRESSLKIVKNRFKIQEKVKLKMQLVLTFI